MATNSVHYVPSGRSIHSNASSASLWIIQMRWSFTLKIYIHNWGFHFYNMVKPGNVSRKNLFKLRNGIKSNPTRVPFIESADLCSMGYRQPNYTRKETQVYGAYTVLHNDKSTRKATQFRRCQLLKAYSERWTREQQHTPWHLEDKATGPDQIWARLMKEAADQQASTGRWPYRISQPDGDSTGHPYCRPQPWMCGRRRSLPTSSRRGTTPQQATIALLRWHRSLRRWWNTSSARKLCVISTSMTFFTMLNMASGKDVRVRHNSYLVPSSPR